MAKIHPTAIVEAGARLAEDVEIGAYSIVGSGVSVGPRTRLMSHVVLEGDTEIGADNEIHPFARIGAPPQHNAHDPAKPSRLIVGDRNIIREQVTMHCGASVGRGYTRVGSDCLFYVGAHVAHDCEVDDHVVMINNSTLGGHTHVGEWATLGGFAACHQWGRIGRHAMIGGLAAVTKDVIPFGLAWGNHVHLEGLNLVGLRRRGFSRETINTMRAAYGVLFAHGGTFKERVTETAESFAHSPEVMEIISFIRHDASRPLCLPERDN